VHDDVDDGLSVPPVDILDEGSRRLAQPRVHEVAALRIRKPRQSGCRLALGKSDQEADVGEDRGRGGGRRAAVPHRAAQVTRHDAAVVDGRTERCQIARCRLGDR